MIYSTPNLGGAELYAMNLLKVLKDDVQFTVVSPENSFVGQRARDLGHKSFETVISYPKYDVSDYIQSANKVAQELKSQTFDLIYTHHLPAAMIGQILSNLWDVPLLLTIDSPYLRPAYEDFMRLVPCYIMSASYSGYDYILENNLSIEDRVFVVQPGIDLEEFHTQQSKTRTQAFRRFELEKKPVIGIVARLVKDKGVDHAIHAAHHMKMKGNLSAKVLIAGDGAERETLENLVDDLNMREDICFMGQLQPEEMPDFYQMMDVYVLATNREGCPISILEAMSSGVPVIATSVGDVPFLVHSGQNGYTIDEPDSQQIANLLNYILQSNDFHKHTRLYNTTLMPKFDNTLQASKVHRIFEKILKHYGG
ncbi:MAG: hypothetical protein Phog2KO_23570 [Phototrophicaceae bacterium]